jgi:hypothetical protein
MRAFDPAKFHTVFIPFVADLVIAIHKIHSETHSPRDSEKHATTQARTENHRALYF